MERNPVYLSKKKPEFLERYEDQLGSLIAILESSFDGIYITNGAADTIWCNHSYEVVSGLSIDEVVGKNMEELVEQGAINRSATLMAIAKKASATIDQQFRTGKQAVVTSTPIFDQNNEIVMVVTNVRDVTSIYNLKEKLFQNEELTKRYEAEIELIRSQLEGSRDFIAEDTKTLEILRMAQRVAQMDTVVILFGETGVGKERFANYIHHNSPRCNNAFIKVNCGAIAENLVESELFGYEPGSFTGAQSKGKRGLFEVADKGTIFLDEVGDLPLPAQVKLLRVLQEGEVTRIGGNKAIPIDVRVLAATNRDLEQLVSEGKFRADLLYRLNVFPMTLPPLRERPRDIPALTQNMLLHLNRKYNQNKKLTQMALVSLMEYSWPGNVRELRNVIERAFILSDSDTIDAVAVGLQKVDEDVSDLSEQFNLKRYLEQIEEKYIQKAFKEQGGVRKAAKSLGMDPATYIRKRDKYLEREVIQKRNSVS